MPYKNKDEHNEKERLRYYQNREKRILYQREYDKNNKDRKRAQDKKRRETTDKNKKRTLQNHGRVHHFPILLKKYNGCQICSSEDKLEIHHRRYTREIKDCMLLCQPCHKKLHRKVFK